MSKVDERTKVAARCCECGAVYSAWVLSDSSIHVIGRKDGCRCGESAFQAIATGDGSGPS
ncbi:hypothetical protein QNM96_10270 [Halostagnicola sp. A-GB9-2]|nr:hypothetical protein [Halostagnicola sp. A-GB9-2]MDJ1432438.1 hypothetical protein [Halostagnicola sp. A-GB9-2]